MSIPRHDTRAECHELALESIIVTRRFLYVDVDFQFLILAVQMLLNVDDVAAWYL